MFTLPKTNRKKWYLADTHFGHEAILEYTDRSVLFASIEEHDTALVNLINAVVGLNDELFFLGDVGMYKNPWRCVAVVDDIRCKHKFLVIGNHDYKKIDAYETAGVFEGISQAMFVEDSGASLYLTHFPTAHWLKAEYGSLHLHGHMHGDTSTIQSLQAYRVMDVGIDALAARRLIAKVGSELIHSDYAPASLNEIITAMDTRSIMPKRHGSS